MAIQDYSDHIILVELPSEPQIRQELDKVMEIVRQKADYDVVIKKPYSDQRVTALPFCQPAPQSCPASSCSWGSFAVFLLSHRGGQVRWLPPAA